MILKGFIFEEAIDPPIHKGRRSDFRVYCVYGKIPYYYVRSTPAVSGGRMFLRTYSHLISVGGKRDAVGG